MFEESGAAATILSALVITLNQYVQIVHPYRAQHLISDFKVKVALGVVWVLTTALAIALLTFWSNPNCTTCDYFDVISTHYPTFIGLIFYIPVFFIVAMYTHIFIIACKHAKNIAKVQPHIQTSDNATTSTCI